MSEDHIAIKKSTYQQMSNDSKLDVLFDYITEMYERNDVCRDKCALRKEECDAKFIGNRKKELAVAGATGFFGGMLGILGRWILQ